ncbi:hypothetical protein BCR32DRAFT_298471 [Anaeromyces robustus]|uniref:Uncharacterized protein n=1 Tax=Anaeromyces robustus TaxID=1754192 RepID=A0A1Y1VPW9_9FUNG|nr:hypothetical protein BCR32DRAFT_298471 [Anaeromyces robustus]|eukprot:ORX63319.1 hypothetical protein BCR32DRAFT_298471 [Anaeromyces robustus]
MSSESSKEKIDTKEKKSSNNNNNSQLNVFSNDGSFLKRFKLLQEQDEKKKANEALKKKFEWEEAIRLRGKRRKRLLKEAKMKEEESRRMKKQRIKASDMMSDSLISTAASQYLEEMKKYKEQSFTDSDHIRPLVK